MSNQRLPNVCMVGTGEYTTGFVANSSAAADKKAGVVGISFFDLRRRGLVGELYMVGTNGTKFPAIRQHLKRAIADTYHRLDVQFRSFPADDQPSDPDAYHAAFEQLHPGDMAIVFTPDDTHHAIALAAVQRGLHVLVAKPLVKTVAQHIELRAAARAAGVLVAMEVHKRWDPFYIDARDQIRHLGDFSFFQSYMSQPKSQLETFRAWAGKSSDINYYLNAHHIDFHVWSCASFARPTRVRAAAATGVAHGMGIAAEDTITLTTDWLNNSSGNVGMAHYTASWIAPPADVHSQQRFHYMAHGGEISTDQAHRGYSFAFEGSGYRSPNPLFMKYAPDAQGGFAGQHGYGYRSFEAFVHAVHEVNQGTLPQDFSGRLATVDDTLLVTAILEAGRRSLDADGQAIALQYDSAGNFTGL